MDQVTSFIIGLIFACILMINPWLMINQISTKTVLVIQIHVSLEVDAIKAIIIITSLYSSYQTCSTSSQIRLQIIFL